VIGGVDSVNDGKSAGGSLDVPLADRWVAHVDASWHDSKDMRIGGDVLSAPLKAEVLALASVMDSADGSAAIDALVATAGRRGRVPDTFAHGTSFGAGLAFIDAGGSLGVSVQRIANRYGIPSRPGAGEDGISIDMGQTRVDLRGELKLPGFFESLQLRAAFGDYHHGEIAPDGTVGTRFARKAVEARLELVQADNGGWTGRSGVHFASGSLDVTGAEAIIPANKDSRLGLFTLQSLKLGMIDLEAAGRIERVSIRSIPIAFERHYQLHSGAIGLAVSPLDGLKIGLNYSHGERAPSAEELLTDGLHAATQAFELGNSTFTKERSNGIEAYIRYENPQTVLSATGYRTDFTGFITPMPTGGSVEGFPVYQYRQLPTRFQGFEVQASQVLFDSGSTSIKVDAAADYVHAQIKGIGPVPRIPPLRIMGGLDYAAGPLALRGEVEWNAAQRRVGAFEYATQAFTLVGASATWHPLGEDGPLTLILSGDNLLNVNGRRAASFTRDFMPVAGRNVKLSAKLSF
jgi:iron complex outermembrane receptor protein